MSGTEVYTSEGLRLEQLHIMPNAVKVGDFLDNQGDDRITNLRVGDKGHLMIKVTSRVRGNHVEGFPLADPVIVFRSLAEGQTVTHTKTAVVMTPKGNRNIDVPPWNHEEMLPDQLASEAMRWSASGVVSWADPFTELHLKGMPRGTNYILVERSTAKAHYLTHEDVRKAFFTVLEVTNSRVLPFHLQRLFLGVLVENPLIGPDHINLGAIDEKTGDRFFGNTSGNILAQFACFGRIKYNEGGHLLK